MNIDASETPWKLHVYIYVHVCVGPVGKTIVCMYVYARAGYKRLRVCRVVGLMKANSKSHDA